MVEVSPELEEAWTQLLSRLEDAGRYRDPGIRRAFERYPRWEFLPRDGPEDLTPRAAIRDSPVPIGDGQTISAPHMVAILLSEAQLEEGNSCLEIGAGSGWLAVLAGDLVGSEGRVVGVEIVPELVRLARENVVQAGADNVEIVLGDGGIGHPEQAPYDRIIVSCAAPEVPDPLVAQLRVGGRLVIPVGSRNHQRLTRVVKTEDGVEQEDLSGCAFVPLVGEHGF